MSERKILLKLIEDGKDAEKKLKALDEPVYSIGDRFKCDDGCFGGAKYILVRVGVNMVMLAGLADGNWWSGSVKVGNDDYITQDEFNRMAGNSGHFTRYWDNRKKVLI